MRELIEERGSVEFSAGMTADATTTRTPDPVNGLYDCGCDLVEAAAGLPRQAQHPSALAAVPAVLACMETCLRDLAEASAALSTIGDPPAQRTNECVPARPLQQHERMRTGFRNLEVALRDAAGAAMGARSLASRVIHGRRR
jgi:hypothetical protein